MLCLMSLQQDEEGSWQRHLETKCWTIGNILDTDSDVQRCHPLLSDTLKSL